MSFPTRWSGSSSCSGRGRGPLSRGGDRRHLAEAAEFCRRADTVAGWAPSAVARGGGPELPPLLPAAGGECVRSGRDAIYRPVHGSGKSPVGRRLAERRLRFVDLDGEIEGLAGGRARDFERHAIGFRRMVTRPARPGDPAWGGSGELRCFREHFRRSRRAAVVWLNRRSGHRHRVGALQAHRPLFRDETHALRYRERIPPQAGGPDRDAAADEGPWISRRGSQCASGEALLYLYLSPCTPTATLQAVLRAPGQSVSTRCWCWATSRYAAPKPGCSRRVRSLGPLFTVRGNHTGVAGIATAPTSPDRTDRGYPPSADAVDCSTCATSEGAVEVGGQSLCHARRSTSNNSLYRLRRLRIFSGSVPLILRAHPIRRSFPCGRRLG